MLEQITEEFFLTGKTFDGFLETGSEDEQQRIRLYYDRLGKKLSPEDYRIDLTYPVHLLLFATTWCWDSKTNVPVLVRIAENSPNISLKIINKDHYPFLIDKINGGKKIPQLLIFSKDFYYLDRWVERPTSGYQLYADVRKKYGWDESASDAFLKDYRKRFLKQQKKLALDLIGEIKTLMLRADAIQSATARFFK